MRFCAASSGYTETPKKKQANKPGPPQAKSSGKGSGKGQLTIHSPKARKTAAGGKVADQKDFVPTDQLKFPVSDEMKKLLKQQQGNTKTYTNMERRQWCKDKKVDWATFKTHYESAKGKGRGKKA